MEVNKVLNWHVQNNAIMLELNEGIFEISFSDDDIIRLRYTNNTNFNPDNTFILQNDPCNKSFTCEEQDKIIRLNTDLLCTEVELNPFTICVRDLYGECIIEFKENFLYTDGKSKIIRLVLKDDEKIYGLGQDPMANLNQRDHERRMWQQWGFLRRSGNAGIPFMLSTEGYGLLSNSSWSQRFAIGKAEVAEKCDGGDKMAPAPWPWENSGENNPNNASILVDDGDIDLFIICRDNFDEVMKGYVFLTGTSPMLPKWAFGFMQCKNRYRSQEELLSIARMYRKKHVPCDVLIIDWLWFKEFGDLEWFKKYWPDPQGMLEELRAMGIKVMQAQHPFVEKNSLKYKQFKEAGYLNDMPDENERPTFDHTNPKARDAWWKEIKRLYNDGIRGYWTDMGEIERHIPGTISFLGSREKVHNIYSLMWAKGLYENQRKDFGTRSLSLMRTAYAGIQKYNAALWSGDISATWDVLKDQVVIGQGVCMSGQQFWTTDIGGFITSDDFTPELYIRWFEWGAFCPIFRTHGTRPGNEIWSFGKQTEEILSKFIKLRYELIPYIYSLARMVNEFGKPIMRAMCYEYPDDTEAIKYEHQYMFGPSILVAPVIEKGQRFKEVYLPEGEWYDYWTDGKYEGGKCYKVFAPLDRIPIFIKAGSIIPMCKPADCVEKMDDDVILHIYPGNGISAEFSLYEDDGITFDYEKGIYAKTLLEYSYNSCLKVYPQEGTFKESEKRKYTVVFHGIKKPAKIKLNERDIDNYIYYSDIRTLELTIADIERNKGLCLNMDVEEDFIPADSQIKEKDIYIDADTFYNGVTTVKAVLNYAFSYKAKLKLPAGWSLIEGQEVIQGQDEVLKWVIKPYDMAMPVISTLCLDFEIIDKNNNKINIQKDIDLGYGFVTKWQSVGSFDNKDDLGLETVFEPEIDMNRPYYNYQINGESKTLYWSRDINSEYNCFGYVDLMRVGTYNTDGYVQGIAYSKCYVWAENDTEAYIKLSSEKGIKIWVNSGEVYKNNDVLINLKLANPILLKKGWNSILVKSTIYTEKPYSGREYGFNMQITDKNGNVLRDLLYKA